MATLGGDPQTDIYFAEIRQERARQDAEWGGAEHDDGHSALEWCDIVRGCAARAAAAAGKGDWDLWRKRMLQVAAVAVAAIEAHDRWKRRMEAGSHAGE